MGRMSAMRALTIGSVVFWRIVFVVVFVGFVVGNGCEQRVAPEEYDRLNDYLTAWEKDVQAVAIDPDALTKAYKDVEPAEADLVKRLQDLKKSAPKLDKKEDAERLNALLLATNQYLAELGTLRARERAAGITQASDLARIKGRILTQIAEAKRLNREQQDNNESLWGGILDTLRQIFAWLGPVGALVAAATAFVLLTIKPTAMTFYVRSIVRRIRNFEFQGVRFDVAEFFNQQEEFKREKERISQFSSFHYVRGFEHLEVTKRFADVANCFGPKVSAAMVPSGAGDPAPRMVLHVPFRYADDLLVQATDYYGLDGKRLYGHGSPGRVFSYRYGIIGRAWRMARSQYDPNVTTNSDELMFTWGMTREEAERAGKGRRTFLALLLRNANGDPAAVLFLDIQPANALQEPPLSSETAGQNVPAGGGETSDVQMAESWEGELRRLPETQFLLDALAKFEQEWRSRQ